MIQNWQGTAFNQVPDSKNEIHGDKVAKDFGFKGGLVPGVTVSAYLMHPAAVSYGMAFLERGHAHVRVSSPLYDEQEFEIQVQALNPAQGTEGYTAILLPRDGDPCATAEVTLQPQQASVPQRRGDVIGDKKAALMPATRQNMELLRKSGCKAFTYRWDAEHEMSTYLRTKPDMAEPYSKGGFANPAFILGVSNWVLAANAYMNPWVHMETKSRNYAAIPQGTRIVGEMEITDLFEKKGHEFVDALVNVFDAETDACFSSIELRAIYRLRGM